MIFFIILKNNLMKKKQEEMNINDKNEKDNINCLLKEKREKDINPYKKEDKGIKKDEKKEKEEKNEEEQVLKSKNIIVKDNKNKNDITSFNFISKKQKKNILTKKEYKGKIMKTIYPHCYYQISPIIQNSKYKLNNNHKCKFLIILLILQIYFI